MPLDGSRFGRVRSARAHGTPDFETPQSRSPALRDLSLSLRMVLKSSIMIIKVECHVGYRGEEAPRRFFLKELVIEVKDVLDRWLAPDHRYFKIRGAGGATYVLRHDVAAGHWGLWMYDKGAVAP